MIICRARLLSYLMSNVSTFFPFFLFLLLFFFLFVNILSFLRLSRGSYFFFAFTRLIILLCWFLLDLENRHFGIFDTHIVILLPEFFGRLFLLLIIRFPIRIVIFIILLHLFISLFNIEDWCGCLFFDCNWLLFFGSWHNR